MLDVHPPHHSAHSWRDFFIHIATIVVGLLIAIGLEQTVEHVHHRHQAREAREALRTEREINRRKYLTNTANFRRLQASIVNDLSVLEVLRQHPGTLEARLPGVIDCFPSITTYSDNAWKAAQQSNVVDYMDPEEVNETAALYWFLHLADNGQSDATYAEVDACRYLWIDPNPTHLTSTQLNDTIERMVSARVDVIRFVPTLINIGAVFPDFQGGPGENEILVNRTPQDEQQLRTARSITQQKIDAAAPNPNP